MGCWSITILYYIFFKSKSRESINGGGRKVGILPQNQVVVVK